MNLPFLPGFYVPDVVIVRKQDWLVEDFVLACEDRIVKRFTEAGIALQVPHLPESEYVVQRPATIWECLSE